MMSPLFAGPCHSAWKITKMVDGLQELFTLVATSQGFINFTIIVVETLGKGENYNGEILRVRVEGHRKDGSHESLPLIVKRLPSGLKNGLLEQRTAAFYTNELVMHGEVLTRMRMFHEEAIHGGDERFVMFPLFFGTHGSGLTASLALEDMTAKGYRLTDRRKGLDSAHCRLAVRELGRLHALSFALRDQRPDEFQRLTSLLQFPGTPNIENYLRSMAGHAERALLQKLPESSVYVKRFRDCAPRITSIMADCMKSKIAEPYAVICHGDCWTNNFLFKYSEDNQDPIAVCLLDLQESRYASPVTDLALVLYCSTDSNVRRQHYQSLMSEYYDSLCGYMQRLGSDPQKMFPLAAFKDQERRFSQYGLCWALLALHLTLAAPEDTRDLQSMLTSSTDLGGMWNEQYIQRITDIIVDMVDRDFI